MIMWTRAFNILELRPSSSPREPINESALEGNGFMSVRLGERASERGKEEASQCAKVPVLCARSLCALCSDLLQIEA